jgi:vitamin B12 transporter
VTYRIAPGLRITATGTTFKGSLGTGFKIPSLYQLYSNVGDTSLLPERSVSIDAGFEQELGSRDMTFAMTYFHTDFNQLIDFDTATDHYYNVGQATSDGVETQATAKFRSFLFQLAYTYTLARNDITGAPLLHRPKQAISAEVNWKLSDRAEFGAQGRFVGARADTDPVDFAPVQMPSYAVFFLNAHYRICKGLGMFVRLDNIFDRWYEEIDGYGTPGRSIFVGLSEEI